LEPSWKTLNAFTELASCFKSESDGANKKKIVCEELKKMEGLITQQRARVGCLIRKDINMVEYFLVVDYEDKMMIV